MIGDLWPINREHIHLILWRFLYVVFQALLGWWSSWIGKEMRERENTHTLLFTHIIDHVISNNARPKSYTHTNRVAYASNNKKRKHLPRTYSNRRRCSCIHVLWTQSDWRRWSRSDHRFRCRTYRRHSWSIWWPSVDSRL